MAEEHEEPHVRVLGLGEDTRYRGRPVDPDAPDPEALILDDVETEPVTAAELEKIVAWARRERWLETGGE